MQLQEEREAASLRHKKLQTDLKVLSGERDRFIVELWAEQETTAKIQKEFRNILRGAAGTVQTLRIENVRLSSELQTAQARERSGDVPSVDALPILKNTPSQVDVSSAHREGDSSPSLEDVIGELQGRSRTTCGKESTHGRSLKQCSSFDPGALALSRDGSATPSALHCAPKRSRQLLKMASSPSFRKNGDKYFSGPDRRGVGIAVAGCTMQFQPELLGKPLPGTPDMSTGMKEASSIAKHRKHVTQRWPLSFKIFRS